LSRFDVHRSVSNAALKSDRCLLRGGVGVRCEAVLDPDVIVLEVMNHAEQAWQNQCY